MTKKELKKLLHDPWPARQPSDVKTFRRRLKKLTESGFIEFIDPATKI